MENIVYGNNYDLVEYELDENELSEINGGGVGIGVAIAVGLIALGGFAIGVYNGYQSAKSSGCQ